MEHKTKWEVYLRICEERIEKERLDVESDRAYVEEQNEAVRQLAGKLAEDRQQFEAEKNKWKSVWAAHTADLNWREVQLRKKAEDVALQQRRAFEMFNASYQQHHITLALTRHADEKLQALWAYMLHTGRLKESPESRNHPVAEGEAS